MNWVPLTNRTDYSFLRGLSKPKQILSRLKECGYKAAGITDLASLAGVPGFLSTLAKEIKPIAGCEFHVSKDVSNRTSLLPVLAKGQAGWKNLIRASSISHQPEHFHKKPRLNLERLGQLAAGQWIVLSGQLGSTLADVCFTSPQDSFRAVTMEEAKGLIFPDWQNRLREAATAHLEAFGPENVYLAVQLIDKEALPASLVVAELMRWLSEDMGIPVVAIATSHYPRPEDAADQRVLVCTGLESNLKNVSSKLLRQEDQGLGVFFRSNRYHIPTLEELKELHTAAELETSLEIAERCQTPKLSRNPLLPSFPCPDNLTATQHMRQLCEKGWTKKIARKIPPTRHPAYRERLEKELRILGEVELESYFLIVADIVRFAREELKALVGEGRGSGAGCFSGYLLNITGVDPIEHQLLFERFFNRGRYNPAEGLANLPDYDCDFPVKSREAIIDYIRKKYGADRVCQMATFSRMQGRGAIKDVLRVHERCSFDEMNLITQHIPDEAAIADELQNMAEAGEEPSIIRWALEHNKSELSEWCYFDDDGELQGPLALDFAQAIRLEGTKRSQGKHASGVVICSEPLADIAPMLFDKTSGQPIVGLDMRDAEKMGLVKFDILGTVVLDKLQDAVSLIRTGKC